MADWCARNVSVTIAQIVCITWPSPRVWQQPSRKKPVIGSVPHGSSSPPRTLRSVTGPVSQHPVGGSAQPQRGHHSQVVRGPDRPRG